MAVGNNYGARYGGTNGSGGSIEDSSSENTSSSN